MLAACWHEWYVSSVSFCVYFVQCQTSRTEACLGVFLCDRRRSSAGAWCMYPLCMPAPPFSTLLTACRTVRIVCMLTVGGRLLYVALAEVWSRCMLLCVACIPCACQQSLSVNVQEGVYVQDGANDSFVDQSVHMCGLQVFWHIVAWLWAHNQHMPPHSSACVACITSLCRVLSRLVAGLMLVCSSCVGCMEV